jgi:hypothetical protein
MDCKTARLLFDFARPQAGELDAAELAAFEQHLAGCPECDTLARAERGVEFAFAKAMRAVEVPAGLRNRLMERLDRERGDVYLRWFGNAGRVAAAAAAVLLLVGGIYLWNQTHLPEVNMDLAWDEALNRRVAPPGPEALAAFFHKHGYDGQIPQKLTYSSLAYYGMGEFQGRQVPRMIFIAPEGSPHAGAHAEVLLLSPKQFNLAKAPAKFESPTGYPFQLALWRDPTGSTEVVDYTGDSTNWFRPDGDGDKDAR